MCERCVGGWEVCVCVSDVLEVGRCVCVCVSNGRLGGACVCEVGFLQECKWEL